MINATNAQSSEYTDNQNTPDATATEGAKQPLISVIVPVYNTVELLPRCFDSILNQTHKNIELILINDGSTDGSGDVCDQYAKKDARVRVIHQENAGESGARNTGLDAARGEWIALVDCDDYIDLQMYEKLLNAATLQNTLLSACGQVKKKFNCDDEIIVLPNVAPKITSIRFIECGLGVMHWATLYHREIINAPMKSSGKPHGTGATLPLRYDTAVHFGGDRLFVIEALLRAPELAYTPEALYIYDCMREDNTTNSLFSEKKMTWFIGQKKIIELLEPVSPTRAKSEMRQMVHRAFSAMAKTLFSEHADINVLYPQARKEAKGYIGYFLTGTNAKFTSKVAGCIIYLFPRFARVAWKSFYSLNKKVFRSTRIE